MQFAVQVVLLFYFSCCACSARNRVAWVVDDHGCLTPDREAGFCTPLHTCETVTYLLGNRDYDSEEAQEILEEFACGVETRGSLKVCCPYKPLGDVQRVDSSDHRRHPNVGLLPSDCGRVNAWGLMNGWEANLFEFGWSVLLKYRKDGDPFVCGGSLISDRYVLTSASCVRNKYRLIGARIGEQYNDTLKDCTAIYSAGNAVEICGPPPQDFHVSEADAIVHPRYNPGTLENNIALIRLRKSVRTSVDSVATICLPITPKEKSQSNPKYTAIGWGVTDRGLYSPALLKVLTEKVDSAHCVSTYKGKVSGVFLDQICSRGLEEKDFCAEDFGGPLMGYHTEKDKVKTIQYGVLSIRPSTCVGKSVPSVYTSTIPYVGWILDNINS